MRREETMMRPMADCRFAIALAGSATAQDARRGSIDIRLVSTSKATVRSRGQIKHLTTMIPRAGAGCCLQMYPGADV